MASADKDGQMAQWLADRSTILGMEINESLIENRARLDELLSEPRPRMRSLNLPDRVSNRIFRRLRWLPGPAYYWLLDRLTDNNGWRPLFYREQP
jgi:hypothetical protein